MIGEVDVTGVFVPELLVMMLVAYCLNSVLVRVLARLGFYRLVWHRSLFDLGLYVIMLGAVVSVVHALLPAPQ
jgi:hypothetical protein